MKPLDYRKAQALDLPLVIGTWCDSYRDSRSAGLIAMDDWRRIMPGVVKKILSRPGVEVWVAYHPGEPGRRADLYGWIAVERGYKVPVAAFNGGRHKRTMQATDVPLVHYVYVKRSYRKNGIARGLFRAAGVGDRFNYTCRTGVVSDLIEKIPRAEWRHLIARFPKV